jgi:hypothetical protein
MDIQSWKFICLMLIVSLFYLAGWVSWALLSTVDAIDQFWSVIEFSRRLMVPKNYSQIWFPIFIPHLFIDMSAELLLSFKKERKIICSFLSAHSRLAVGV